MLLRTWCFDSIRGTLNYLFTVDVLKEKKKMGGGGGKRYATTRRYDTPRRSMSINRLFMYFITTFINKINTLDIIGHGFDFIY